MKVRNIKNAIATVIAAFVIFAALAHNTAAQQNNLKFDSALQADFIAGMSGDAASLARAMERADRILATNPNDAETLVWHGAATFLKAGKAFESKNYEEGWTAWQKALTEVNRAVELAPENFQVRMVRGSTYINAFKRVPDQTTAAELRDKGIVDYEKILSFTDAKSVAMAATQKRRIFTGLIEAYENAGNTVKADFYRAELAKLDK